MTWAHTSRWVLDAGTLSGAVTRIGTVYTFGDATFADYYNVGTVTFTACPEPAE